jgi:hypothetical protein
VKTYTEEVLREAVSKSKTKADILRFLWLQPKGGNYATLANRLKKFGISTDHLLGIFWAKGQPGVHRHSKTLEEVLVAGHVCNSSALKRRLIRVGLLEAACRKCGITEW